MSSEDLFLLLVAVIWGTVYALAAARPSSRGGRWPAARTAWFISALALAVLAFSTLVPAGEREPAGNALQHMLLMMAVAPMVAFSAPLTLVLRTLPSRARRTLVRELKDPAFKPLSGRWAPALLAADYYVTMFIYELTPLRSAAEQHAAVHFIVHQYMLLCGLLFWLPVAAVDPVRLRLTERTKTLMIGAGLPAFALLGAIKIAGGDTETGWVYVISGAVLTVAALLAVRRPSPAGRPNARVESQAP